ncbi:MAG: hypothetical protein HKN32_00620 [Flavobacteriales bacterium]|nr:hypothetical protein [Flavobacteriales bacterium]
MRRLLKLELKKLTATKYFKVLSILWLIAFLTIPLVGGVSLAWMDNFVTEMDIKLKPSQLPIFDFVDIWQNLAYFYKCITIFICFSLVISMCNEYSYKTVRQNVIDGLSKKELWLSKVALMLGLTTIATIGLLVLGLIVGFIFSPVVGPAYIFKNIEFVGAYFIHVFLFLSFCLFIANLIKRSGFAIALVLFYVYIVEFALSTYLRHEVNEHLANLLPIEASWKLIHQPFTRYLLSACQDYVAWHEVVVAIVWIGIFQWGSYQLLAKRDL